MPNVGKSTLFNALTQTQRAEAANYPFCTIQPNAAKVAVKDDRLDTLARLASSERVSHATRACLRTRVVSLTPYSIVLAAARR